MVTFINDRQKNPKRSLQCHWSEWTLGFYGLMHWRYANVGEVNKNELNWWSDLRTSSWLWENSSFVVGILTVHSWPFHFWEALKYHTRILRILFARNRFLFNNLTEHLKKKKPQHIMWEGAGWHSGQWRCDLEPWILCVVCVYLLSAEFFKAIMADSTRALVLFPVRGWNGPSNMGLDATGVTGSEATAWSMCGGRVVVPTTVGQVKGNQDL